jgi:hypothetical protein
MRTRRRLGARVAAAIVALVVGAVMSADPAAGRPAYARSTAVAWAKKHVNDKEVFPGNDCTWFVTQALWAGKLPKSASWDTSADLASQNADALRKFVVSAGYATFTLVKWSDNTAGHAQLGDVIAYDWWNRNGTTKADGIMDHLAIVTKLNSSGYPYVTQHSLPRLDRYWSWDPEAKNKQGDWIQFSKPGSKAYLIHIK